MVGEVVGERYELEELIGTGGMSSVFRAHDLLLERPVALKILHEHYEHDGEYVERFRREARAAAQLSHANIVTVIDRGESEGRQFIVFEYVEGENLKELVARTGALPVRRALDLAIQIGRALAFAHAHGLVHRDVKPQNVLFHDGQAKVTDFGIARTVDVQGLTETGTVLGTSDYISPEQASGQRVDAQSDVYSLGAVLFELLTGRVPYAGDNFVAVAMRHLHDPVPSVLDLRPDVPLRLDAAVQQAMAKDPAERFASMDDFVDELEKCAASDPAEPDREATMILPAAAPPPRLRRAPVRRLRWPLAVAVAGVLAIATVVGVLLAERDGGRGGAPVANGPAPVQSLPVHLSGVGAYDPDGDGSEHDEDAASAADANPSTYWRTQTYRSSLASLGKRGVGVVLDAGRSVKLSEVDVRTDTPGFTAEIEAGSNSTGPFRAVSGARVVNGSTSFRIREGAAARYYVVWITQLPGDAGSAHVNEVTAR